MLTISPAVRIYLATGATDLRCSIDGLAAVVRARFELEPTSGHLFLFRNRRGDRVKILVWDTGGFWVLYKRLERGTFACLLPADSSNLRNFAKLFPAVPAASRTVTFPDAATARGASARTRRTKRY